MLGPLTNLLTPLTHPRCLICKSKIATAHGYCEYCLYLAYTQLHARPFKPILFSHYGFNIQQFNVTSILKYEEFNRNWILSEKKCPRTWFCKRIMELFLETYKEEMEQIVICGIPAKPLSHCHLVENILYELKKEMPGILQFQLLHYSNIFFSINSQKLKNRKDRLTSGEKLKFRAHFPTSIIRELFIYNRKIKKIVILDDISTTGATLIQAYEALVIELKKLTITNETQKHFAKLPKIECFTIAKTPEKTRKMPKNESKLKFTD